GYRAKILVAVTPRLRGPLLDEALHIAQAIRRTDSRARALAVIAARLLRATDREKVLADALQAVAAMTSEHERIETLNALLPHLPEGLLGEALELIERVFEIEARARLLVCAADCLPEYLVDRARRI